MTIVKLTPKDVEALAREATERGLTMYPVLSPKISFEEIEITEKDVNSMYPKTLTALEEKMRMQELELSKFKEGQTTENARSITPEDLESLKALVEKRQIIAEALSQRITNMLGECREYMKIIEFLDPEYAKRLREMNKFWDTEDLR